MFSFEFVSKILFENIQGCVLQGSEFIGRCPYCGDSKKSNSKKRFHLNYKNENSVYFHCFNCGITGSFIDLYCYLKNISKSDALSQFKKEQFNSIKEKLKRTIRVKEEIKENVKNNFNYILDDCISLEYKGNSIIKNSYRERLEQFYKERAIDFSQKLFIAFQGKYKGRIIIPIFSGKDLVYFQGRTLINSEIKYINPKAEKSLIIFNADNFDKDKNIVIVEGLLDAISIGNNATVALGKEISDEFLTELYKYTNKDIIIALDNDASGKNSTKELIKKSKYANKLKYFIFSNEHINNTKDFNELKLKEPSCNIFDYINKNSYSKLGYITSASFNK